MFFIAYAFKGQVHKFAGRVKTVSHSSCRTSAIFKYFVTCLFKTVKTNNLVGFFRNKMIRIYTGFCSCNLYGGFLKQSGVGVSCLSRIFARQHVSDIFEHLIKFDFLKTLLVGENYFKCDL